jgi:transcriptional regulator with XRE-family HTH domain
MIGTRIALLRKLQGLSQAQLASALHISPSTVGMYEQGRREPDLNTVVAIEQLLDTSVDYLCTGKERLANNKEISEMDIVELCITLINMK